MINLLPGEDKKDIKREYLRRVFVVAGTFLFINIAIGIILLYPVFYSLAIQRGFFQKELDLAKEIYSKGDKQGVTAYILEMNSKLSVLKDGYIDYQQKSEAIKKILTWKNDDVFIEGITFLDKKVIIVGTSKTRDELLTFVDQLKTESFFKKIDSPASNLLKGVDLKFTINIDL